MCGKMIHFSCKINIHSCQYSDNERCFFSIKEGDTYAKCRKAIRENRSSRCIFPAQEIIKSNPDIVEILDKADGPNVW